MSQSNAFVNGLNWRKPFHPSLRALDGSMNLSSLFEGFDFLDDPDFEPTTLELNNYDKEKFAGISQSTYDTYGYMIKSAILGDNRDLLDEIFRGRVKRLPGIDSDLSDGFWTPSSSPFRDSIFDVKIPVSSDQPFDGSLMPNLSKSIYYSTPWKEFNIFASPDYETVFRILGRDYFSQSYTRIEDTDVKVWNSPVIKAVNTEDIYDSYTYPDGSKIVVGRVLNDNIPCIIKYNPSGNKPYYFNANITELLKNSTGEFRGIVPVDGGKFLVFGGVNLLKADGTSDYHFVIRINEDGTLDDTYTSLTMNTLSYLEFGYDLSYIDLSNNTLKAIEMLKQGSKYLLAFNSTLQYGTFKNIIRIDESGALDETFDSTDAFSNGSASSNLSRFRMSVASNGKIVLTCHDMMRVLDPIDGQNISIYCVVLDQNGSLDSAFTPLTNVEGTDFFPVLTHLLVGTDIYLFVKNTNNNRTFVKKMDLTGSFDNSFVFNTEIEGNVYDAIKLDNGKFVIAGSMYITTPTIDYTSINASNIIVLNSDFTLDWDLTQIQANVYISHDESAPRFLQKSGNRFSFLGGYLDRVSFRGNASRVYQNDNGNCHYLIDTENFVDASVFDNRYFTRYDSWERYNELADQQNPTQAFNLRFEGYLPNPTPEEQAEIDSYKSAFREYWTNPDFEPNMWEIWNNSEYFGPITELSFESESNITFNRTPGTTGQIKYFEPWDEHAAWNPIFKRWDFGLYNSRLYDAFYLLDSKYTTKHSGINDLSWALKPFSWSNYYLIKHVVDKNNM